MTQSTYLTHLRQNKLEPRSAARLRGKMRRVKQEAAGGTEAERQTARYEVYRLTAEWWRVVRKQTSMLTR